jgi:hypothetical protein
LFISIFNKLIPHSSILKDIFDPEEGIIPEVMIAIQAFEDFLFECAFWGGSFLSKGISPLPFNLRKYPKNI